MKLLPAALSPRLPMGKRKNATWGNNGNGNSGGGLKKTGLPALPYDSPSEQLQSKSSSPKTNNHKPAGLFKRAISLDTGTSSMLRDALRLKKKDNTTKEGGNRRQSAATDTKRKMVRFPSKNDRLQEFREISRLSQKGLQEREDTYEDKSASIQRRRELKEEIQEYRQGRRISDNLNFTTVGIQEFIQAGGITEQKQVRKQAVKAVLQKQLLHKYYGNDSNRIPEEAVYLPPLPAATQQHITDTPVEQDVAKAYTNVTEQSKAKAHREALALHRSISQ